MTSTKVINDMSLNITRQKQVHGWTKSSSGGGTYIFLSKQVGTREYVYDIKGALNQVVSFHVSEHKQPDLLLRCRKDLMFGWGPVGRIKEIGDNLIATFHDMSNGNLDSSKVHSSTVYYIDNARDVVIVKEFEGKPDLALEWRLELLYEASVIANEIYMNAGVLLPEFT